MKLYWEARDCIRQCTLFSPAATNNLKTSVAWNKFYLSALNIVSVSILGSTLLEQPPYRPLPEADRKREGGEAHADFQSFYSGTSDHISLAKKVTWPNQTSHAWAGAVPQSGQKERARIIVSRSDDYQRDDLPKNQHTFERLEGKHNLGRTSEAFWYNLMLSFLIWLVSL